MTEQVASIGVKMDTGDVDKGIKTLDQLIAAGPKVEKAIDGIGKSSAAVGGKLKEIGDKGSAAGEGAKKGADGVDALAKAITAVTAKTTAAAAGLDSVVSKGVSGWAKNAADAMEKAAKSTERLKASYASLSDSSIKDVPFKGLSGGAFEKAKKSIDDTGNAASQAGGKLDGLAGKGKAAGDGAKQGAAGVKDLSSSMDDLSKKASIAAAGVGAFIGLRVVSWAVDSAKALFEASAAVERFRNGMDFASARGGAAELVYLRNKADELGISFKGTAQAYQGFQAAARGTSLEGQKARDIFETISKASTVMGLSTEQTTGTLLALQQMISKGTVQSEELRGQLGERLPGAFQIAARSMGVTTAELGKMLEQGEVIASDFLPKFAKELEDSLGGAAEKAANRLDASTARMGNSWEAFKQRVGDSGISQQMATELNFVSKSLNAVTDRMDVAKASGAGMWSQLGSAAYAATVIGAFSTIESSANVLNYTINGLTGNILNLDTNVSVLPDSFKSTADQVAILEAKVKEADGTLSNLQALGAKPGHERWYAAEVFRAQTVANEYRNALAAKKALTGDGGGPNPADANYKFNMRGQSYRAYDEQVSASKKELEAFRMRAEGINQQYFKDLKALQTARGLGTLTEEQYISEVGGLAQRTYDSSTTGRDAKKAGKGGGAAAKLAERLDAAGTSAEIAKIKSAYQDLSATYSGEEAIMEASRRAGLVSEREYYDSKLKFIDLNIKAKQDELLQENKALEAQSATGVKDIERDKKIQTNKDQIRRLEQEGLYRTKVLTIEATAAMDAQKNVTDSARRAAEDYLATLQKGFDRDAAGVGMGANERNVESGRQQIQDRYLQQRTDIFNELAKAETEAGGKLNAEQKKLYADRLAIVMEYEEKALASFENGVQKRMEAEADWKNGADRAMKDYAYNASNVAELTNDAFSNGLKGMEDALVTFVTTGKLSFSEMANSIVADITRIIIKQQISNALGVAGSGGSGGGGIMGLIGAGIGMFTGTSGIASAASALPGDSLDNFISLKGLSGGRARGGGVSAGGMYEVLEDGPEILNVGNRNFLMMGNESGSVTPGAGRGGGGVTNYINVTVQPPAGASRETALQFGRTAGQQIAIAQSRNG